MAFFISHAISILDPYLPLGLQLIWVSRGDMKNDIIINNY